MSQPKPPDPYATSQAQLGFNTQAAQAQQKANMIGQQTPYGSLSYTADPNAPGGYTAQTTLTPAQQQLLNLQQAGQTGLGVAGVGLGQDIAGMFGGGPPDLSPEAMTKQLMGWQTEYMQPWWNQQQSNMDTQLANQGITPGSAAFNNAQNLLSRNISDQRNQFFAQSEPLAFSQKQQQYSFPLQLMQALLSGGKPTGPSFVNTPQAQVGAPNYQQAAQNQYQAQQQQYNNMMQGMGQLGGMALGGFMANPGLFGAMPSFSGGWGNMFASAPTLVGGQF